MWWVTDTLTCRTLTCCTMSEDSMALIVNLRASLKSERDKLMTKHDELALTVANLMTRIQHYNIELAHPYVPILCELITSNMNIIRICLSYVSEKWCINCPQTSDNFYVGDFCCRCMGISLKLRRPGQQTLIFHTLRGDLVREGIGKYFRETGSRQAPIVTKRYQYRAKNLEDAELLSYWNTFIMTILREYNRKIMPCLMDEYDNNLVGFWMNHRTVIANGTRLAFDLALRSTTSSIIL
jgi:hypothetical protein